MNELGIRMNRYAKNPILFIKLSVDHTAVHMGRSAKFSSISTFSLFFWRI